MREGTSGFWIEEKDGEISIGYEDYGVGMFGGGNFEKTYTLDKENSIKFRAALEEQHSGELKEMVESAFGRSFSDTKFWEFCKVHGIRYGQSSWVSGGW